MAAAQAEERRFQAEQQRIKAQAEEDRRKRDTEHKKNQEELAKIERARAENMRRAEEQQRQIATEWPKPSYLNTCNINIGVTGLTGVGKSSVINRYLGKKLARTDVTECTMEPTPFMMAVRESNWSLSTFLVLGLLDSPVTPISNRWV